jgi:hypothetical protein
VRSAVGDDIEAIWRPGSDQYCGGDNVAIKRLEYALKRR